MEKKPTLFITAEDLVYVLFSLKKTSNISMRELQRLHRYLYARAHEFEERIMLSFDKGSIEKACLYCNQFMELVGEVIYLKKYLLFQM